MRKYVIIMIILGLVEIGLALYLTEWRKVFWDIVNNRNYAGFIHQLEIFTVVALLLCVITASATYAGSLAAIKWREKLNSHAHHKTQGKLLTGAENLNQRIQEDCREYPQLVITIGFGFVKALTYVAVFSTALVIHFSYLYLTIIGLYAIVATIIARKVAKPLIALNYKSQQVEATYRNSLTDINFTSCLAVMLGLAQKTKRLQYFQSLYSQFGVVLPLIVIAPAYFAAQITIGGLMQANSIMSTIVESLSYGVNSFDQINRLLSCRRRLKEINVI